MRIRTRKSGAYSPAVDALEGRQAVSSLLFGPFDVGKPAGAAGGSTSDVAADRGAGFVAGLGEDARAIEAVPSLGVSRSSVAPAASRDPADTRAVNTSPGAGRSGGTSETGRVAGVAGSIGSGIAPPSSMPAPLPVVVAPASVTGNGATTTPRVQAGGIRPLTLAPTAKPAPSTRPVDVAPVIVAPSKGPAGGGQGPTFNFGPSGGPSVINPTIHYDGVHSTVGTSGGIEHYDIIGDLAHLWLTVPPGSPAFQNINWTFTGTAMVQYSSQDTPDTADGGFVNHQLMPYQMGADNWFYWGASGGTEELSVSVSYVDGSIGSASITVDVAFPDSDVDIVLGDSPPNPGPTPPSVYSIGGDNWLSFGDPSDGSPSGIRWSGSADSRLNDGTFATPFDLAVVQLITEGDFRRTQSGTTDEERILINTGTNPPTSPRPLVDFLPNTSGPFYEPTGSADSEDYPGARLDSGWDYYQVNLTFQDHLMYRLDVDPGPTVAGIWLPLGVWGWRINASASTTPNPMLPQVNGWYVWNEMGTPSHTGYAGQQPAWPMWQGAATTYIATGWKTWS